MTQSYSIWSKHTLREAARYNRKSGLIWSVIVATSLVAGIAQAIVLVLVVKLAGQTTNSGAPKQLSMGPIKFESLNQVFAATVGLALLVLFGDWVGARLTGVLSARSLASVRGQIIDWYSRSDWGTQSTDRDGQLQELTTTHAGIIANWVVELVKGAVAVINLLAFVGSALFVNWAAALIIVALCGLIFVGLRPLGKRVSSGAKEVSDRNLAFVEQVSESTNMAFETSVFGVGGEMRGRMDASIADMVPIYSYTRYLTRITGLLTRDLGLVAVLGAMWGFSAAGVAATATLGAVVVLLARSITYTQTMQETTTRLREAVPYLHGLADARERYGDAVVEPGTRPVDAIGTIRLEGTGLTYPDGTVGIAGVDLEIRQGEAIGIVGTSGAGKSSLLQVLLRLRQPTAGQYTVDGIDAFEVAPTSWHHLVAAVAQEPHLFRATLAENIRFFRDGISDEQLQSSCERAGLTSFLNARRDGLDTEVSPRGGDLSGGQKQRIGIARALAGSPSLLVLDEPTSALDNETEQMIIETLRALQGQVTIVIIAHRLTSVAFCDRIVVMSEGKVSQIGPPEVVLAGLDPEAIELS